MGMAGKILPGRDPYQGALLHAEESVWIDGRGRAVEAHPYDAIRRIDHFADIPDALRRAGLSNVHRRTDRSENALSPAHNAFWPDAPGDILDERLHGGAAVGEDPVAGIVGEHHRTAVCPTAHALQISLQVIRIDLPLMRDLLPHEEAAQNLIARLRFQHVPLVVIYRPGDYLGPSVQAALQQEPVREFPGKGPVIDFSAFGLLLHAELADGADLGPQIGQEPSHVHRIAEERKAQEEELRGLGRALDARAEGRPPHHAQGVVHPLRSRIHQQISPRGPAAAVLGSPLVRVIAESEVDQAEAPILGEFRFPRARKPPEQRILGHPERSPLPGLGFIADLHYNCHPAFLKNGQRLADHRFEGLHRNAAFQFEIRKYRPVLLQERHHTAPTVRIPRRAEVPLRCGNTRELVGRVHIRCPHGHHERVPPRKDDAGRSQLVVAERIGEEQARVLIQGLPHSLDVRYEPVHLGHLLPGEPLPKLQLIQEALRSDGLLAEEDAAPVGIVHIGAGSIVGAVYDLHLSLMLCLTFLSVGDYLRRMTSAPMSPIRRSCTSTSPAMAAQWASNRGLV